MEKKICSLCKKNLNIDKFTTGKGECKECRRKKANNKNVEKKVENIDITDERKEKRKEFINGLINDKIDEDIINVFVLEENLIKMKNDEIKICKLPKQLFKMIKKDHKEDFEKGYIRDIVGIKKLDKKGNIISYSVRFII